MVKSARKSETKTFGIMGQFHRFKDLAGKRVYVPILKIQKNKTNKQTNKQTNKNKNKPKTKQNLHLG